MVGTAVGGLIGWTGAPPAADPSTVRGLLEDLGLLAGADLGAGGGGAAPLRGGGVGGSPPPTGLKTDGVAGPRTVHLLVRYAKEARELHRLDLAA
ncbi:peptidoglycan-binding protein [Actinoplanes sp. NPDC051411]|uniref:peptidoglycan-binding protein n=1 Tax=Actinoplanes sp. NPDC051411 TaxID=3155522 RepID=UPI00342BC61C